MLRKSHRPHRAIDPRTPPAWAAIRRLIALGIAVTAASATGCQSQGSGASTQPKAVAECKRYEELLSTCFHRPLAVASLAAYTPRSDEDRERIASICETNMARVQTACAIHRDGRLP
jgi:hypothetical protein